MKKLSALAVLAFALVFASTASAHTTALTVTQKCGTVSGTHDLTWTFATSDIGKAPTVAVSNRASIPVGSPLAASTSFAEVASGAGASATITVRWNDGFEKVVTASVVFTEDCIIEPPPNTPACPADFPENLGVVGGIQRCGKTTTTTVPGPAPPPVFGKPVCPPGTTQTSAGDGFVVCASPPPPPTVVTKIVKVKVKGPIRWRDKIVKVKYCPKPKPCPVGSTRLWDGKKYVCAVQGSG